MAETVPQKRVLPPRERRESAAKRRVSSPIATPTKAAPPKGTTQSKSTPRTTGSSRSHKKKPVETTPTRESKTPVVEDVLSTKLVENYPLPTVRTKQPKNLSIADYQSIAESAVLAASLHQSRTKWLTDEMFTKYWQKPSKKKGEPQLQQPDTKSMVKLGPCTMVIEPHRFEVMIYTVRDPNTPAVQYKPPPAPYYPPPPPNYQPYPGYAHSPTPGGSLQARPPHAGPPQSHIKQEPGRQVYPTPVPQHQQPRGNAQHVASRNGGTPTAPSPRPTPVPNRPQANNESEKNPVIQKLATAAASDPELKALMQVVAASQATPLQLRTFQRHIDRLNAIIAQENAEAASAAEKNKAGALAQASRSQNAPSAPLARIPTTDSAPIKKEPQAAPINTTMPVQPAPQIQAPSAQPPVAAASAPSNSSTPQPSSSTPTVSQQSSAVVPARPPSQTSTPTPQPSVYTATSIQPKPGTNNASPQPSQHPSLTAQQPSRPLSQQPQIPLAGAHPSTPYSKPPTPVAPHPGPYPPPPLYATHYPPPPPPQPLIKHIVFENLSPQSSILPPSSTRYLFPEHAVLDFSPSTNGTIILASFFVIRKGSQLLSSLPAANTDPTDPASVALEKTRSYYKEGDEYFQPVTMRLIASNPRVLETIARAAKPLKAVQDWMEDVIKTKKRAQEAYLALQLPRQLDGAPAAGTEVLAEKAGNITSSNKASKTPSSPLQPTDPPASIRQGTATVGLPTPPDFEIEYDDDELKDFYEMPDSLVPMSW